MKDYIVLLCLIFVLSFTPGCVTNDIIENAEWYDLTSNDFVKKGWLKSELNEQGVNPVQKRVKYEFESQPGNTQLEILLAHQDFPDFYKYVGLRDVYYGYKSDGTIYQLNTQNGTIVNQFNYSVITNSLPYSMIKDFQSAEETKELEKKRKEAEKRKEVEKIREEEENRKAELKRTQDKYSYEFVSKKSMRLVTDAIEKKPSEKGEFETTQQFSHRKNMYLEEIREVYKWKGLITTFKLSSSYDNKYDADNSELQVDSPFDDDNYLGQNLYNILSYEQASDKKTSYDYEVYVHANANVLSVPNILKQSCDDIGFNCLKIKLTIDSAKKFKNKYKWIIGFIINFDDLDEFYYTTGGPSDQKIRDNIFKGRKLTGIIQYDIPISITFVILTADDMNKPLYSYFSEDVNEKKIKELLKIN